MKIFLHEIAEIETELTFSEKETWVLDSVQRVDENVEETARKAATRPIHVYFSLRKVDEVVVVSGKIETFIELICSRCATAFKYSCQPNFSALFCKDPVMAGVGHLQRQGNEEKPMGQNQGFARHAHDPDADRMSSEGKDLDITYLSHEYIDLGEVLTEQLQIQVPFQPLCKEDCKGICSNCGTDLNLGRCACSKLNKQSPFSVLRDLKI